MPHLSVTTLPDVPLVKPGDDLAALVLAALAREELTLADGDIIVLAQKIVSKAEGRLVALASVTPGAEARELAARTDKDPRLVQLIIDESSEVLRAKPGVIIVRHRLGHVGANAGIDQSNIEHGDGDEALLLPRDPDASAVALREALESTYGCRLGVLIADSLNRPWRLGTTGGAIGCAGFTVLDDQRGGVALVNQVAVVTASPSRSSSTRLFM